MLIFFAWGKLLTAAQDTNLFCMMPQYVRGIDIAKIQRTNIEIDY
jgi:hypothetical protein